MSSNYTSGIIVTFYPHRVRIISLLRGSCLYCTLLCSTVQYSTVQYSTVQYSTVQYSTVQGQKMCYFNQVWKLLYVWKDFVITPVSEAAASDTSLGTGARF